MQCVGVHEIDWNDKSDTVVMATQRQQHHMVTTGPLQ